MVSMIENEQELENVVGGIKAKDVAKIVPGAMAIAVLVVGGKFVYDVYQECSDKTGEHGLVNAVKSWGSDELSAANITHKSPWDRAVSSTANYILDYTNNN